MGGLFTRYFRASSDHEMEFQKPQKDQKAFDKGKEMEFQKLQTKVTFSKEEKAFDEWEEMEFQKPQTKVTFSKEQKAFDEWEEEEIKENEYKEMRNLRRWKEMISGIKFVQEKRREWWNVMENYLMSHQIEKQELMREKLIGLEEEIKENQRKEIRIWRTCEWEMDCYEDLYMKKQESTFEINKRKEEELERMEENINSLQTIENEWLTEILTKMEKNIFTKVPGIVEQVEQRWTVEDRDKMKEIKFHQMEEQKCWREWLMKMKVEFVRRSEAFSWGRWDLTELEQMKEFHQWMEQTIRKGWREVMTKRKVEEFGQWCTVSDQSKLLPRYAYHLSLLNWFNEGISWDIPLRLPFKGCHIIIGGNITNEQKNKLFITSEKGELAYNILSKASLEKRGVLIVYFVNNDPNSTVEKITKLGRQVSLENATILYAVNNSQINNDRVKQDMIEAARASASVDFVEESRSEIIIRLTRMLERRMFDYLQSVKKELSMNPRIHNVKGSLFEANAILKRLTQAECYPTLIGEDVKQFEMESGSEEVDDILQSFGDKIIYYGYNEDQLYIIVTNQSVKENLENVLQECMDNQFEIHIQDKLEISELTRTCVPLHGAKFVYLYQSADAFKKDTCFATTGSLMKTNKGQMVALQLDMHSTRKSRIQFMFSLKMR